MSMKNVELQQEHEAVNQSRVFSGVRAMTKDADLMRLLVITILVFVVMSLLRPDRFFTLDNFSSMAFQFPEFGLLAIAIMLAMLSGGIDLSIVGIANLSGILAARILTTLVPQAATATQAAMYSALAIIVSLGVGIICGLINGFLIAEVGITPILATLGTMQLYTGIAIVMTKGRAIYGFPEWFTFIGNGSILGIPIPFIVFAAFCAVFAIILNRTSYGFKLYMLGTNPTASRFSGINNVRVLLTTYLLSGFLSAASGLVVMARTNSAKADYGTSYTLQVILIAVMGGVNPNGGFGNIFGLILAILTLQFLSSGFNMLRFSNFFKEFIWGAVLLLVMVVNYVSNTRRTRQRSSLQLKKPRDIDGHQQVAK
jgi:simple sugar transport system permease protein